MILAPDELEFWKAIVLAGIHGGFPPFAIAEEVITEYRKHKAEHALRDRDKQPKIARRFMVEVFDEPERPLRGGEQGIGGTGYLGDFRVVNGKTIIPYTPCRVTGLPLDKEGL